MAILNRFSAILLYCDATHFLASRCRISGDSRPAILGIVRFAIRDSVPLRSRVYAEEGPEFSPNFQGLSCCVCSERETTEILAKNPHHFSMPNLQANP